MKNLFILALLLSTGYIYADDYQYYEDSYGYQYQYDLNEPDQELEYELDLDAQLRDDVNNVYESGYEYYYDNNSYGGIHEQ